MPLFQYKAVSSQGKTRSGCLDAANISDLESRLSHMGLDRITCRIQKQVQPLFGSRKVKRIDLINFCFHMEQLTRANVRILDGLADLRDSIEHPRFRDVIATLINDVEGGKTLSAAMDEHPQIFNTLFVNLIKAGETTGEMAEVFDALNKTLKWQDELSATNKKLLLFPVFVGSVVLSVTLFLMIYLVPQLVTFIKEMGGKLPFHTRALIAVSNFCVHYWYLLLILPIAAFSSTKVLIAASSGFRFMVDDWKLKMWLIGPALKKILLSRLSYFFAMMYAAGIPILQCLEISEGIVANEVIKEALQRAGKDIREGSGIAFGFENTGLFPPLVIRMLKIGETTGALDQALLNVSYFYDRDIRNTIGKVQALIEPIMTLFLGAILGWVMLSILDPIYDMITKIKL
jgi:type IV pilus assembly protein PilC